jgi:RimJ/RimL family protein N-acetyltransferase
MLIGDRIMMTPLEVEDLPHIVEWRNQSEVRRQFFHKSLLSYSGQSEWYRKYLADGQQQIFLARKKVDQQPIGMIGLYDIDIANHKAEIGSTIVGNRDMWGKGFGAEMIRLLLGYAFTDLNMNRIYAYAVNYNQGSVKVKEKCGFRIEGILREAHYCEGSYHDVVLMGIVRDDLQQADLGGLEQDVETPS